MAYATVAEFREYMGQVANYSQQTITISGSPGGGTFTLTYEGSAMGAIAYNATATAMKTALAAHVNIGSANVKVKGPAGGPWEASFSGDAGQSPLALGTNSLTGGTSPTVAVQNTQDILIQKVLNRATQIIDTELGYSFATAAISTRVVYGDGTDYLVPPDFVAGSVTAVTTITGHAVPTYIEQDGALVVKRDSIVGPFFHRENLQGYGYYMFGGWGLGVPYTVAATFGYSAVPDDIKEACLEIAVRIWRAKDAGFSDVVGVEGGGAVGYNGKYPAMVKAIFEKRRKKNLGIY